MQLRPALLIGAVIALAGTASVAPASVAAPRPVKYCNVLTDPPDDHTGGSYFFVNSPALDILSADIATGKKELVAVLRIKSVDLSSDQWIPYFNYSWALTASLNGMDYDFKYEVPATMLSSREPSSSVSVGPAAVPYTFSIDTAKNAFVWKVERKNLPSLNKKPGQRFVNFGAQSGASGSKDKATSPGKFYPDKAPSCVIAK